MTKKELYTQILKSTRQIHKAKDLIKYYQELLKQNKFTEKKDIQAFIKGMISRLQKDYSKAEEYFKLSIKEYGEYSYSYNGLGVLYFNQEKYNEAEKYFKLSIKKDKDHASPYNGLGAIYNVQKKYDEAEKYYKLSIKKDINHAYPYNNLGGLYENQKKYDEAEKYYKLSIEKDKNYAHPYNNLGGLYGKQKKNDEAEKYYKLSIEKDKDYASPHNSLGIIYANKKKYSEAEKHYKLAFKADNTWGGYHYNLALTYNAIQDLEKAKTEFEIALSLYKKEKDNYGISRTEIRIKNLKTSIKSQSILDGQNAISSKDSKIIKILKEIEESKIDKQIEKNKENYFKFLEIQKDYIETSNNITLEVLRRWNSYTPIIANNYYSSKGGGYFLQVKNEGVVIDPGFNFIDNFRGSNHKFYEITTLIISHAHNDHTSDLESILTLLYKYNKNLKKTIPNKLAEKKGIKIADVKHVEIENEYKKKRKIIKIFIPKSVFLKYSGLFDLFDKNEYNIHIIEKENSYKITTNYWFNTIEAKHNDIISNRDALGFIFNFNDVSLVYTGDTGWSKKINRHYQSYVKKHVKDYVILLAHIGGFKDYEVDYISKKGKERDKCLYKNHLGRIGLCKINEIVKPDICLISEFGEEFKKHRIDLAKIYQKTFNNEILFIPADIGLKFDFNKKKFYGVTVTDLPNKKLKYDYINPEEIVPFLFRTDFSLHYYHKELKHSKDRLDDILKYQFNENINNENS